MFNSILVVCVGNICRSPVGERLLAEKLPQMRVSSEGISALVDHAADETMSKVAEKHGLSLAGHKARQFTAEIGSDHDLILVMEAGHKREILRSAPQLSGRIMLFDQWSGGQGIPDPYTHGPSVHEAAFQKIAASANEWTHRLGQDK